MFIKRHQIMVPMVLNLILIFVCVTAPLVNGAESRKLGETTVPTTNGDEKCVPCGYSSPPPPSPPPPAIPPPSPPPPSPKKSPPSSQYCPPPPPPPSSFIYITGPPGNLYPVVDENFNGASRRGGSFAAALSFLVGLFSLLAFW